MNTEEQQYIGLESLTDEYTVEVILPEDTEIVHSTESWTIREE